MDRFHRQEKLAWCLELLGMAVPPLPDTAPANLIHPAAEP